MYMFHFYIFDHFCEISVIHVHQFFFKDYTNWIKLDINWIMNSSMIFLDWKKRLGQSYEEMKRTVNRDSYNATPLVVQISFFCMKETQEPQPHPRVALQGETTPHLDPMSMKSPRLSVLLSSLKGISYWTALYFKYMEILWDMWHSFLFHRAAKKDVLGFQKRNTTMPIFIWHMLAPMFCTKNCYKRYFYVK